MSRVGRSVVGVDLAGGRYLNNVEKSTKSGKNPKNPKTNYCHKKKYKKKHICLMKCNIYSKIINRRRNEMKSSQYIVARRDLNMGGKNWVEEKN